MFRTLVVDDDVCNAIASMLKEQGFEVVQANNGASMREILGRDGRPFHAIILDAVMPGETGLRCLSISGGCICPWS